MTKRRSAKGEMVDFDLLRIKEQIAAGPKPVNVQSREEFIDRRVRRRAKKQKVAATHPQQNVDVDLKLKSAQDVQQEMIDNKDNLVDDSPDFDESDTPQTPNQPRKVIKKR